MYVNFFKNPVSSLSASISVRPWASCGNYCSGNFFRDLSKGVLIYSPNNLM
jgi:hypothetical protein